MNNSTQARSSDSGLISRAPKKPALQVERVERTTEPPPAPSPKGSISLAMEKLLLQANLAKHILGIEAAVAAGKIPEEEAGWLLEGLQHEHAIWSSTLERLAEYEKSLPGNPDDLPPEVEALVVDFAWSSPRFPVQTLPALPPVSDDATL